MLEEWTVAHAVRELIANALDEATFGGPSERVISLGGDDRWHGRDFGRGLHVEHLTPEEPGTTGLGRCWIEKTA